MPLTGKQPSLLIQSNTHFLHLERSSLDRPLPFTFLFFFVPFGPKCVLLSGLIERLKLTHSTLAAVIFKVQHNLITGTSWEGKVLYK